MPLRLISFEECKIDDNWVHMDGKSPMELGDWIRETVLVIQAKQHNANITVTYSGDMEYLKFKNNARVSIKNNILAFDTSNVLSST